MYRRVDDKLIQIVVPKSLRPRTLFEAHPTPVAAHFAARRTFARSSENYFWPHFRAEVEDFCRRCKECQRSKAKNTTDRAPLQHLAATRPLEIIAIDMMGPLPSSASGNLYIIVSVDHFSGWTEC